MTVMHERKKEKIGLSFYSAVLLLGAGPSLRCAAWNDEGQMVVAQIAWQQMTALTRQVALAGYRLAALLNEIFR